MKLYRNARWKYRAGRQGGKVSASFLFLLAAWFLVSFLLQVVRSASSGREHATCCLVILRAFISKSTGKWILPQFQKSRQKWNETNDTFQGSFLFTLTYMVSVSILKCSYISIKKSFFYSFVPFSLMLWAFASAVVRLSCWNVNTEN